MKKTLLSLSLITVALLGKAQNCSELFISEYVEGTGNNKAIEIYNSSPNPISLANYRILRHDNGNTSFTAIEGELQLPTNIILQPYSTYVMALNLTDPSGTGQTAPISTVLEAAADTLLCPGCATGTGNSRVLCFNGDDALALQKNIGGTWTNIDIFGCRGEQPTNSAGTANPTAGWTSIPPYASMPAGYNSSTQGPYFKQYWTQDKTLRRKSSVKVGVSVNPAFNSFNPSVEWDSTSVNGLPSVDNFAGLGSHTCDCSQVGVKEINKSFLFSLFPNPATDAVTIASGNSINKFSVFNVVGQEVKSVISEKNLSGNTISIANLAKGVYTVIVTDDKNNQSIKKLIIE
ncbi:MAG TPA: lamin tail domain-containing protein [Bacteroidia bacterium]|nr:lamin tail domain-containing protein [Bacteroidia bacterium]